MRRGFFAFSRRIRFHVYLIGSKQVDDHLRSSSTISASVFSAGPITTGRDAPRILPPLAGIIPGIRRRRRTSSEVSGFALRAFMKPHYKRRESHLAIAQSLLDSSE